MHLKYNNHFYISSETTENLSLKFIGWFVVHVSKRKLFEMGECFR